MVYLLKMVIVHCYVKEPDGTAYDFGLLIYTMGRSMGIAINDMKEHTSN